jgi:hypothetical protein
MAIGQLIDYRRFIDPSARCAVLLPALPREDLVKLLQSEQIAIYHPTGKGFEIMTP